MIQRKHSLLIELTINELIEIIQMFYGRVNYNNPNEILSSSNERCTN